MADRMARAGPNEADDVTWMSRATAGETPS